MTESETERESAEPNQETPSQREREQQTINAVNSSIGYASRAKMAEYEMDHVVEGMMHAPK